MGARRVTLRVQPPVPFGEVTLVPATLGGRPDADMARAMSAALADVEAQPLPTIQAATASFPAGAADRAGDVALYIMTRLRRSF